MPQSKGCSLAVAGENAHVTTADSSCSSISLTVLMVHFPHDSVSPRVYLYRRAMLSDLVVSLIRVRIATQTPCAEEGLFCRDGQCQPALRSTTRMLLSHQEGLWFPQC